MGRGVGGVPQSTRPPPPRAPSTRTAPCLRRRAGPLGPHGSCLRGRPPAPSSRRGTSPPPPLRPYSGTRSCAEPHFRQESGLFRVPMPRHASRESPVSRDASWLQRNTKSILRANHGSSARSPSRDGCHPKKSQILTRRPILLARAQPVTARLARAVSRPYRDSRAAISGAMARLDLPDGHRRTGLLPTPNMKKCWKMAGTRPIRA